jgi:uncharacterized protein (DUF302 family)
MRSFNIGNGVKAMLATVRFILAISVLFVILKPAYAADDLIVTKKSIQDYTNAMSAVQMGLEEKGFKVQFVQRIDIGLAKAGYHSDKYRIVFFMPKKGVASVLSKCADLADMFPLKVTVYQDKGKVYVFSAKNSIQLDASIPQDVRAHFKFWDKQIDGVINNMF